MPKRIFYRGGQLNPPLKEQDERPAWTAEAPATRGLSILGATPGMTHAELANLTRPGLPDGAGAVAYTQVGSGLQCRYLGDRIVEVTGDELDRDSDPYLQNDVSVAAVADLFGAPSALDKDGWAVVPTGPGTGPVLSVHRDPCDSERADRFRLPGVKPGPSGATRRRGHKPPLAILDQLRDAAFAC